MLKYFFVYKGQTRPLFVYFRSFHATKLTINDKSVDGMLGIQTQGSRMVRFTEILVSDLKSRSI